MSTTVATSERRHDLDALRAMAMLAGIGLHAALAFAEFPWVVSDSQKHGAFGLFFFVVHGFRMPLFFLLSGFFTAMLWRKRGMGSLVVHRMKRILLPLVIGVFTIVPAVHFATRIANDPMWRTDVAGSSGPQDSNKKSDSIWAAAATGDIEFLQEHLTESNVNSHEPLSGATPLAMAAAIGQPEVAEYLLEHGADPNVTSRDKATPLHGASFFGRKKVVKLLLAHDANVQAIDSHGATPFAAASADWGTTKWVSDMFRIPIDKETVMANRVEIKSMLTEAGFAEQLMDVDPAVREQQRREKAMRDLRGLYDLLVNIPLFGHLWFLVFLCWLVVAFLVYAGVAGAVGFRGLPDWLMLSPLRYAWLIPLTCLPQWAMAPVGFGPDTSIGLIPKFSCLTYYAIFFFAGVFYWDSDDKTGRVGQYWWLLLPVALFVVFPLGLAFSLGSSDYLNQTVDRGYHRGLAVVLQATYAWLMTFGCMGLFRRLMSAENPRMRYLSDSSYWLYLAHVPLVILGQGVIRDWNMSPFLKFLLLCVVTCGLLLLSYQYLVRYTIIGTMLNGKRTRPAH